MIDVNEENSMFERVNSWIKNSVTLKLITITILMLLLLIPTSMIKSIITEREQINLQTVTEVNSKWAESQQINGPILTIPLIYEYEEKDMKVMSTEYYHILPEYLDIRGNIDPKSLQRGIYEVVVYESELVISGQFRFDAKIDQTNLKKIDFSQSFVTIGISDLRGIEDQVVLKWNAKTLLAQPGSKISGMIYSGLTFDLSEDSDIINNSVDFEFALNLRGSQNISFVPLGNITEVDVTSNWATPSFNGNFLPDFREVTSEGFTAKWKILQLNRNFPQSWKGINHSEQMNNAAFGINLIVPLDDYQKTIRSAKYAVMTITLTFLIFFLVEILDRRKIHPFQYVLVGLSLCLFYVLLLSISEHSSFDFAYGISTLGIVTMISLYSISIFKSKKQILLLVITLTGIYGFLYVTLQMADYALLMGSIGLTLILGATMYFTRNINWYKINLKSD